LQSNLCVAEKFPAHFEMSLPSGQFAGSFALTAIFHNPSARPLQNWRSGFRQKAAIFNFQDLRRSAETPLRLIDGFAEVSSAV
jgi:hypothetical protein